MDATDKRNYTFADSVGGRGVRVEFRARRVWRNTLWRRAFWRRTLRAARRLVPPRLALRSRESKILGALWSLAALTTLSVALAQGFRMFLLSLLAVAFGTLAALWMLNGPARR